MAPGEPLPIFRDRRPSRFLHRFIFRARLDFLIRDSEVEARGLAELAFEQLRRSLIADGDLAQKWDRALDERETSVEKLGAIHLLSFGIGAFKIQGLGSATDLVFGDPLVDDRGILQRVARALVLTEWKVVRRLSELQPKTLGSACPGRCLFRRRSGWHGAPTDAVRSPCEPQ
jgi:hypothetical protein